MYYLFHDSASFGRQIKVRKLYGVKSVIKDFHLEVADDAFINCGGDVVRLDNFLFFDCLLGLSSFLLAGCICFSLLAWFHSL